MADVYGEVGAQQLADPPWLERCGAEGWIALSKDKNMLRKQPGGLPGPQIVAIQDHSVRVLLLMTQNLKADAQVASYLTHAPKILNLVRSRAGPWVHGIFADGMREVWPCAGK